MLSWCSIKAQDAVVYGIVYDKNSNETLIGTTIATTVAGKMLATSADENGYYELKLPAGKTTLKVSMTGYKPALYDVRVDGGERKELNVYLEEESIAINEVVVSATKNEKPISEVTVSMDILKPNLIENTNATAIDQTLEKVPGVNIIDGQANIRGGSGYSYGAGSRVLLLVDDMPILTGDAGYTDWGYIPLENISQVEIIKGAASALYGSSALNGVINVRTRYATNKPITKFSIFNSVSQYPKEHDNIWWKYSGLPYLNDIPFLSNDTTVSDPDKRFPASAGFDFLHARKSGKWDFVVGTNVFTEDSWRREEMRRRLRLNGNIRYRFTDYMSAGLNFNAQASKSVSFFIWGGADNTVTPDEYYISWSSVKNHINVGRQFNLDPFFIYTMPEYNMRLKVLGRYYHRSSQNNTNQSTLSDIFYGETQLQKHWDTTWTVTAGLVGMYTWTDAELYTSDVNLMSSNVGAYAQADWKWKRWNVSLGTRYEMNAITGVNSENNPDSQAPKDKEAKPVVRIGANYHLAAATYLRASFGQGYRFPTIAEKFVETNIGQINIFSSPALNSETGYSAELGLKQGIQISEWKGIADASVFYTEYQDMMEFTFGVYDDGIGFRSLNIGDTRVTGFEVSLMGQGRVGNVPISLLLGYTHLNPQFKTFNDAVKQSTSNPDKNVLKYRFRHTAKADIEGSYKRWVMGGALRYYSFMEAIDIVFQNLIPGLNNYRKTYTKGDIVADIRLAYQLNEYSKVSVLVNNLFNHRYTLRPALIEAPRTFTIKYAYDF
ncbi:MAG: TonB-dependent receptor [Sphingobacteriales bacterium]|nr:TonB-dependent receptor [Sphingobacteriales bacterium]